MDFEFIIQTHFKDSMGNNAQLGLTDFYLWVFDSDFLELLLSDVWLYQIAKSREIQEMRGKTDIE